MKMNDFIFTKERPEKYLRHIVFWIAQGVFWVVWAGLFFTPFKAWMAFVADCYQSGDRCSDDHNQTVNFIRIHRSFIVSLSKIKSYTCDLIWVGKMELPVSRMYRHEVEQVLK